MSQSSQLPRRGFLFGALASVVGTASLAQDLGSGSIFTDGVSVIEYSHTSDDPDIVSADFDVFLREQSADRLVLIGLYAENCPRCEGLKGHLEAGATASGHDPLVVLVKTQDAVGDYNNLSVLEERKRTPYVPELLLYHQDNFLGAASPSISAESVEGFIHHFYNPALDQLLNPNSGISFG